MQYGGNAVGQKESTPGNKKSDTGKLDGDGTGAYRNTTPNLLGSDITEPQKEFISYNSEANKIFGNPEVKCNIDTEDLSEDNDIIMEKDKLK